MEQNWRGESRDSIRSVSSKVRSFKVILLGESSVGKTCLMLRFCDNTYSMQVSTIGCDIRMRTVVVDNELLKLVIWDTAGQELMRQGIVTSFYRGAQAAIFVYDMTNVLSFKTLNYWLDECQQHDITTDKIPCILVGNKSDCVDNIAVSRNMAKSFAERFGLIDFFETSAALDSEYTTVSNIFMILAHKLKHTPLALPISDNNTPSIKLEEANLQVVQKKKKSNCCSIL